MATIRFEKTIGSKVYKRVPNLVQGPLPRSQTRTATQSRQPHFTLPSKLVLKSFWGQNAKGLLDRVQRHSVTAQSNVGDKRWGSAAQATGALTVKKSTITAPSLPKPVQYFADLPDTHRSVFTVKDGYETIKGVCFAITGGKYQGDRLGILMLRGHEHRLYMLLEDGEAEYQYANVKQPFSDIIAGLKSHLESGKILPLSGLIQKSFCQLWAYGSLPFNEKGYGEHRFGESGNKVHFQIKGDCIEMGVTNQGKRIITIAKPYLADWKDLPSDRPTTLYFRRMPANFAPNEGLETIAYYEDTLGLGYALAVFPGSSGTLEKPLGFYLIRKDAARIWKKRDLMRFGYGIVLKGQKLETTDGRFSHLNFNDALITSYSHRGDPGSALIALRLAQAPTQRDFEQNMPSMKILLQFQFGQELYGSPIFANLVLPDNNKLRIDILAHPEALDEGLKDKWIVSWKLGANGLPRAGRGGPTF